MKRILSLVLVVCMMLTLATFPATAATTNPKRVKIFTMGDSFTAGICEPNAYRYYVYEPLIREGGVFEFIGPHTSGDWRVTDMYKHHGGVGGAVIGYEQDYKWNGSSWGNNSWSVTTSSGKTLSSSGTTNSIHYRLFAGSDGSNDYKKTTYGNYVAEADIVTLYIGLNDYYNSTATGRSADIEFVKDSYRTIVNRIFEINPDVSLYVMTLNEVGGLRGYGKSSTSAEYANSFYKFNEWLLNDIVSEYETKGQNDDKTYNIHAISLNQDGYKMNGSDVPSDESHPNESGNKKIGTQVYMGIKDEVLALNAQGSDVAYNPTRVTDISINKTSADLKVGENLTIISTITPSNAEIITTVFSSSNESVATVDHYGRVTAVGAGEATITATALDSIHSGGTEIKATCNITVSSDTYKKVDADYPRVFSDRLNDKTKWTGSTNYVSEDGAAYKHTDASTSSITSTETVSLDYKFSMAFDLAVIGAETKEVNDTNRNSYYTALTVGKYQLRVGINGRVVAFYYDGVKKGEKVFGTPVSRQNKDRYTLVKDGATVYVYRNNELLFTTAVDESETVEDKVVLSCNGTNIQNVRDIEIKSTYGLKKLSPTVIDFSTATTSEKVNYPATNIVDNDIKTRYTVFTWKSSTPTEWNDTNNNYVVLDLGDYYDVSNLDIYWGAQGGAYGNSMPDSYTVSYSLDNINYTQALSYQDLIGVVTGTTADNYSDVNTSLTAKYQSGQTGTNRVIFSYGNVKEAELNWTGVRYIKIQMTKIVQNPSIAEIEVFTTGYAPGEEPDGTTTYYTVKYVDKNGKEIRASKRVNGQSIGAEVTEQAVEIDGYEPEQDSQTIVLENTGNVITFTYTRVFTGTPEAIVPAGVTTDMTAVNGSIGNIIDGISMCAGSPHWNFFRSSNLPAGDGSTVLGTVVFDFGQNGYYNLTQIWFNMGGCHMKYGKLYGSNSTNDPNSSAWTPLQEFKNVTFTKVDANDANKGQELTQEVVHSGYYRYFKLEITGLSATTGLVWLESTFMAVEGEATEEPERETVEYTVEYVDEDKNAVAQPKNVTGKFVGDSVTEKAPAIVGYTIAEATKTITLVDGENVITFTYTARTKATYTVTYVDSMGTPIAETKTVEGYVDDSVTEKAVSVDGYEIERNTETITLVDGTNSITFTYSKVSAGEAANIAIVGVTGKTTHDSSSRSIAKAYDGDTSTHFTSDQYSPSSGTVHLTFELEKEVTLDSLVIDWGGKNWGNLPAEAYTVSVSQDGSSFEQILSYEGLYTKDTAATTYPGYTYVSGSKGSGTMRFTMTETGLNKSNVKYIKVVVTKATYRPSIYEISVTGISAGGSGSSTTVPADSVETKGANIRLQSEEITSGIRFGATIDKAQAGITDTYEYNDGSEVKFGMFMLPKTMLGGSTLTEYLANGIQNALNVVGRKYVDQTDTEITFTAVLINIPASSWDVTVVAVPYVFVNGTYTYFAEWEQSYVGVAQAAIDSYLDGNPNKISEEQYNELLEIVATVNA